MNFAALYLQCRALKSRCPWREPAPRSVLVWLAVALEAREALAAKRQLGPD
jgi:hypothetical protein